MTKAMKKPDAPLTTKENLLIGGAQVVEQMVKEHKPDEEIEKATAALHTIACDGDLERAKELIK